MIFKKIKNITDMIIRRITERERRITTSKSNGFKN